MKVDYSYWSSGNIGLSEVRGQKADPRYVSHLVVGPNAKKREVSSDKGLHGEPKSEMHMWEKRSSVA